MSNTRGRDTKAELLVRRSLHMQGFRFRVNFRPEADLRRTADIVFTRARVAVFVDGCFWHACPVHYTPPRTRAEYWVPKIERNASRDRDTTSRLEAAGWTVLRFWEHEEVDLVVERIAQSVRAARANGG